MAKTLGDARKLVKTFNAQVTKGHVAVPGYPDSVEWSKKYINIHIVDGLPDGTELPQKAEKHLSYIEEMIKTNAEFAEFLAEKAKKAKKA